MSVCFVAVHLILNLKPFPLLRKWNGGRRQTGRGRRDATAQLCGSRWYSADAGAVTEGFQGVGGGVWCREDKQDKQKKGSARRPKI